MSGSSPVREPRTDSDKSHVKLRRRSESHRARGRGPLGPWGNRSSPDIIIVADMSGGFRWQWRDCPPLWAERLLVGSVCHWEFALPRVVGEGEVVCELVCLLCFSLAGQTHSYGAEVGLCDQPTQSRPSPLEQTWFFRRGEGVDLRRVSKRASRQARFGGIER